MDKTPCTKCGVLVLQATYEKNNGLCMLCARGITKEVCELCGKEATVLSNIDGKRICLKCNMQKTQVLTNKWNVLCDPINHPFNVKNFQIKPFPHFSEVFKDKGLNGFFYPLCSVKISGDDKKDILIHLVSYNGLWIDDEYQSAEINGDYSVFQIEDGKYIFNGNLKAFKGYSLIPGLYNFLSSDFEIYGMEYLKKKTPFDTYSKHIKSNYNIDLSTFDSNYYLEIFFSFSLKKLECQLNSKTNLFEPYTDNDFVSVSSEVFVNEKHFKFKTKMIELIPVGMCRGNKFFFDGNNILCFIDKAKSTVYCINQYS